MSLFGHKQKTVEPDVIPTTVEQAIPIRDVCEDGIFLVGRNLWSKTYRFTDVNYATASKEDKEGMFFAYSEILNTFDAGAMSKITVNNRRLNQTKFRENNMLELQGDSLDKYRNEYNRILAGNANLSNGITHDKYLTVTVEKKTEEEARAYFNRISAEFAALFAKLGSKFEEVTAEEKLRILFDFFHYGAEDDYHYDAGLYTQRGYSFKDAIAPDCLEFRTDYFKMDGRYGRVLFIALALYLIRPAKRAEIDELWADSWSFGDEDGKKRVGAKVAAILTAVLVVTFVASLGVTIYRVRMGYDIPFFPASEKALDKDVQYQISEDGKELTILLPYEVGGKYDLENSDPESFVLKESRENGDTYLFLFSHEGTTTEKIKLTFSLMLGDTVISIKDYSVTVSFKEDGRISAVGG